MNVQIKKAIRAGNSSAVVLPRAWLDKEVRVELVKKTDDIILLDVIDIIKKHISLEYVIGIYLVGSYARGEEDENSDIDVLVVTKDVDKKMISEGMYSLFIISSELLKQKLALDLFPVGQMIREAKPLLNSSYIGSFEVTVTEKNVKWYIDTTDDKLKIIKEVLRKAKNREYLSDVVAYTLVLRIRTLYIIKKLIKNENYSKKDFVKIIKKVSAGVNSYEGYLRVKNNLKEKDEIGISEVRRLCEYLEDELINVRKLIK